MSSSIQGLSSGTLGIGPGGVGDRRSGATDGAGRPDRAEPRAPERAASLDERAPVDPRLWDALSRDERAFYLRHAGPITYGPSAARAALSADHRLGGRIDVRA